VVVGGFRVGETSAETGGVGGCARGHGWHERIGMVGRENDGRCSSLAPKPSGKRRDARAWRGCVRQGRDVHNRGKEGWPRGPGVGQSRGGCRRSGAGRGGQGREAAEGRASYSRGLPVKSAEGGSQGERGRSIQRLCGAAIRPEASRSLWPPISLVAEWITTSPRGATRPAARGGRKVVVGPRKGGRRGLVQTSGRGPRCRPQASSGFSRIVSPKARRVREVGEAAQEVSGARPHRKRGFDAAGNGPGSLAD